MVEKNKHKKSIRLLVTRKLEMVSKEAFRHHFDLITELIGDSPGVYALYDDNNLYYVGKSIDLRNRVKQHLRDQLFANWTHFSLYLARNEEQIHEIESLIVRIANPKGNRVVPRGKSSGPLRETFKALVKQKHKAEFELLFGSKHQAAAKNEGMGSRRSLNGLVKQPTSLSKTYKGKDYKATLRADGTIMLKGKRYRTPTAAAKSITRTAVNGLDFWFIADLNGDLVKLKQFMKKWHG
jgi:Restriction Enzyme Adenine Methylase Associated/GIY-YIG catalytic domain